MQALYQLSYAPVGRGDGTRGYVTDPVCRASVASVAMADAPPKFRYNATLANEIERRWQDRWEAERVFWTPNRTGLLAEDPRGLAVRPPLFVLDMFPYPSGKGLHVGHPLGFIATDVWARFQRMNGFNVLHAMGYDAFGLPAEQYAVQTGQHPRVTTEQNIATMKAQLRALGLAHDPRRGPATTDVSYYRWTQWIFLQIYNSWYDEEADRARPIAELVEEFRRGACPTPDGIPFDDMGPLDQRELIDGFRLAYVAESNVNWCPGLGTVLANEEVTADGRSDRGNFPVYRRPLKQWMLRITTYADRLIADLDILDWSESIKTMQRNWIGRSTGANIRFPVEGREDVFVEVFTTRPDTIFGATFMVLAPEHPLVDEIVSFEWPGDDIFPDWESNPVDDWKGVFGITGTPADAVHRYREFTAEKSDLERQADTRDKTGVFTGGFVVNPVNDQRIPVFIADYVLMGYGTGAIMAVPGQDERDWEFAETYNLPIVRTVQPPADFEGEAYVGDGPAINSGFLDGKNIAEAKAAIIAWLETNDRGAAPSPTSCATGCSAGSGTGVSRSRSSTTNTARSPFPTRCCPSCCRRSATSSRRPRTIPTRCPNHRWRAPRTGSRSSSTSTARSGPATGSGGRSTCARRTRCRSGPDRVGTTCATSIPPTKTR